jgi:beta-xylosidase
VTTVTTILTSRALAAGTTPGRSRALRPTRPIAIAVAIVLAGVAVLAHTSVSGSDHQRTIPTRTAASTAPAPHSEVIAAPAGPSAGPRQALGPAPRGEDTPPLPERPLSPQPPADGRDAPDPAIVHDGDRWALFSTQVGYTNLPVALSDDLRTWSQPTDALPELPAWAEWGRTWAPGVLPLRGDGGFVLYFAARSRALGRQCIGVATATTIAGPYSSPAPEPLVCQPRLGGSIDPQPFVDRDGTSYLLWKADANAIGRTSQLFAQRLRPDDLALVGDPVALLSSDASWERPLIENPALLVVDGTYLLVYSGGRYESAGYATGYAVCRTPLGPCDKQTTEQPVLASNGDEAGTGGASVVTGAGGGRWLAYHAWTPGAIGYENGGARSVRFATLEWSADGLVVVPSSSAGA